MTGVTAAGAPNRTGTHKGVRDQTGREKERLEREKADAEALEASIRADQLANARTHSHKDEDLIDYTDEARKKAAPVPVIHEPEFNENRKRRVRVLADIDRMTFGKEIIFAGDFTDPGAPKMPILGGLKEYSFKEGKEYLVGEALYIHLRDLGYVYDQD